MLDAKTSRAPRLAKGETAYVPCRDGIQRLPLVKGGQLGIIHLLTPSLFDTLEFPKYTVSAITGNDGPEDEMIRDLVLKNRSYRRFHQEKIDIGTLRELVDLARLSASGSNLQPLKYILSCDSNRNAVIAPFVGLGGNPPQNERPTAYVIILGDKSIRETVGCDHGIASQSILLGAAEKGLGGCIVGNVKRDELRQALSIPSNLDILLVLVLGKPQEMVVIDDAGKDGVVKSYWDEQKIRHVPKRALNDIIVG